MPFDRYDSRFSLSDPIETSNGKLTYGLMKKFRFMDRKNLNEEDIKIFVITADFRGKPHALAERLYGNENLFWILIFFNRVENPFEYPHGWPNIGLIIEYPSAAVVRAEL